MAGEIVNRVANSKLVTIDLEDYYPGGTRTLFDIKDWLYQGLVLKEKEFRQHVKTHDWEQYKDHYMAVYCSSDAIIPSWTYMLVAMHAEPFVKKVIVGSLETLESVLFHSIIDALDVSKFEDKPVIIKGCANKPIPDNAYVLLSQKLKGHARSIMYGEACSSVPLFKRK